MKSNFSYLSSHYRKNDNIINKFLYFKLIINYIHIHANVIIMYKNMYMVLRLHECTIAYCAWNEHHRLGCCRKIWELRLLTRLVRGCTKITMLGIPLTICSRLLICCHRNVYRMILLLAKQSNRKLNTKW